MKIVGCDLHMRYQQIAMLDGWPTQARFWLEWGSSTDEGIFPRLVRAFLRSTPTQSPHILPNPLRSGESCSIANLPDVHTIHA